MRVRHSEAVEAFGVESDNIKFREVPETKVLSIYHQGAYDNIGEAYSFIMKYAEDNGCTVAGLSRPLSHWSKMKAFATGKMGRDNILTTWISANFV